MQEVRRRYREQKGFIVFDGRPDATRGVVEVLTAFKLISRYFNGVKLIITGVHDARIALELKMLCKRMCVEDKVLVLGFIPREKRFEIAVRAKLMLYPSHVDAFSYAFLESLHLGTVVVGYRIPALEMYYGNVSGVELVEEGDVEALVAKAVDILEKGVEAIEVPRIRSWGREIVFALVSATSAVLGLVKEFKEANRDALAMWCREYAKKVENYIDTLDLLLDDEVYEGLVELGIIKK